MATVLHLLKGTHADLAGTVIAEQLAAGDRVTAVLLPGASPPALPAAVALRHVPEDLSYPELLNLIFSSDHVLTW
jgi:hypothetical protein